MNKTKAVRIARVQAAGNHALRIHWLGGAVYTVDLHDIVFRLKGLRPLRDTAAFAKASIDAGGHCVTWTDDLDLGADRLWELSLEQNGRADTAQFLRWRWRHGLSLSAAAEALGVSRRMGLTTPAANARCRELSCSRARAGSWRAGTPLDSTGFRS